MTTRDAGREVTQLKACINDLIGVVALPALWSGAASPEIVRTLLDALLARLNLEFVYVRLNEMAGEAAFELARRSGSQAQIPSHAIGKVLQQWSSKHPHAWPPVMQDPFGDGDIAMVFVPLGMHAEIGVLAAGSRRADFPGQTERLLLSVAANQAALGLQEARLFKEQQRLAGELDRTVAQRTAELAAANTELQREIAEHRLSDEALSRLRSELAHVSRVSMLGALTASIAHEVQQPLSGIVTNSSTCLRLLAADPPDIAGARETARRAIRDGNRAADVITRLRALFAKRDLTTEPVDLNEVTREVIALSVRELQHNGVALRSDLAGGLPPVAGDRVQLQQVVLNLLLNASEAMSGIADRQRDVMVSTELESGDRVRLNVRDTGVGIDPQIKDKLFDAFYTTKADGMGIGLAVSRSIIENHRGRLWAASNDGPGATFSFTIPCTPDV